MPSIASVGTAMTTKKMTGFRKEQNLSHCRQRGQSFAAAGMLSAQY
jgi:hypothetical protein